MNKKLICALCISMVCMMTSCGKHGGQNTESSSSKIIQQEQQTNNAEAEKIKISDIRNSLNSQEENIKNMSYGEFGFDNFTLNFPENITYVQSFDKQLKLMQSEDEIEYFKKCLNVFIPEKVKGKNLEKEITVFTFENNETEIVDGEEMVKKTVDGNTVYEPVPENMNYADFKTQKKNLIKSKDEKIKNLQPRDDSEYYNLSYNVDSDSCYFEGNEMGVWSSFGGKLAAADKQNAFMYTVQKEHSCVDYYIINDNQTDYSDKKYKLWDGNEVSIQEAVDKAREFLNQKINISECDSQSTEITGIKVYDLGNGKHGYEIHFSAKIDGITFESLPVRKAEYGNGGTSGSDGQAYFIQNSTLFMMEKDRFDYMTSGPRPESVLTNVKKSEEIIPADKAMEIALKEISQSLKVDFKQGELIYTETDGGYEEVSHCEPCWRFTGSNSTDSVTYAFYVNAVTGKFHYVCMP